ncbi:MAG: preprotein translocase subunit SecG [Erysipelotrichales bacterium]|nr:preprotein translocase subunit SecG [Erysipelotrichales bacterium]
MILADGGVHFLDILFLVVAVILIVLSLLQGGKSDGASGAITGGGLNIFAKQKERGSEKVVSIMTFAFAIVFLFLAILVQALYYLG